MKNLRMPRKTGRISIRDKKSGKCGEPGGRRLHQNAALEDDVVEADEPESPAWIQAIWVRLEKWRILSEARRQMRKKPMT